MKKKSKTKNKMLDILKIVIIIFTISVLTANVQAADYSFNRAWGSNGTGDGQFIGPSGVSIDSAGNVYVVDTGNARIQKFNSDGTYLTQWGSHGNGSGQFNNPYGISVDSQGNVYVVDTYNYRVQRFNSDGTFITQWGSKGWNGTPGFMYLPWGISVDSAGNVYVADTGNNRIQKFDSNGTYLAQFGSLGSGDGQLYFPQGVSVDSAGKVYVADYGNERVEVFNSDGTYFTQWGSLGSGDGQFNKLVDVSVDSAGNVYAVDYYVDGGNNRIQKFNSTGTYLTQFGSLGSGDGQTNDPSGVAVDSAGNVYVADTGNNRIQKFSPTPTILSPNGGESWNRGETYEITWNGANNPGANVIIELLKNGAVDSTIVSSTANDGSYNWTIPSTQTLGTDYKIKVTSTTNSDYTDTSDNDFTIGGINVISPNGGETWARGTTNTITWDSAGTPGADVKIELLKNGAVDSTIVSSTANIGSYDWAIPSTQTLGIDYEIRITSTSNSAYADTSDNDFTIGGINIVSPNGGEVWARGTDQVIAWDSAGTPGADVKIELLKNGAVDSTVVPSTANDGSYTWTIPPTQILGTDYEIRITSTSNSVYTDTSDNDFTIGGINIISPNGGEAWARGTTNTITWDSAGTPGADVTIQLLKNGTVVETIASSTPNDGSQAWTIFSGEIPGIDYRIRITSTSNSAYTDDSDNNFSITKK